MIHPRFPRYSDFHPAVPVWSVTPDVAGCIHRFFDTSPFSPSGRYLAVFQLPFEDRTPQPGDEGQIGLVDLVQGEFRVIASTRGWEPQLGANLNWGASDHELFFNDVDPTTWTAFAWKMDPLTGARQRLGGGVYHASPDGRWLICPNLAAMRRTQPGYGVMVPDERMPRHIGPSEEDGFYLTDTVSGETRLLISIAEILRRADPPVAIEHANNQEIYGFHAKFSPDGSRLMLSLRWFPATDEPRWNLFKVDGGSVRFAWVTVGLDGGPVHCTVGPEQWIKGGHHATWFLDGSAISMNLNIRGEGLRFVRVNADGSDLRPIFDVIPGSGHPTIHRDGRFLLTDCYTQEATAYGDGTVPLRWIHLATGTETALVRINTAQPCPDGTLRVDPHPAWDRTGRWVAFNAFIEGSRRVFVSDLAPVLA